MYLTDGFQTWIRFNLAPGVLLKEREVQPPDVDGGGEIDTSTMRNSYWRTKQPKSLRTLGDMTVQASYDPLTYSTVVSKLLNKNNTIQVLFPAIGGVVGGARSGTLTFWGWLDKFTPASLKEGEFPMAELKVHCSNQNGGGSEVAPVMV